MKHTMHFTSVVGREGKFDPSKGRNLEKLHARMAIEDPRQLDLAAGFRVMDRRSVCTVDLGGHNPRHPHRAPTPPGIRREREEAARRAAAQEAPRPDTAEILLHFDKVPLEEAAPLPTSPTPAAAVVPTKKGLSGPVTGLPGEHLLSTRKPFAAVSFTKAKRFPTAAATPEPAAVAEVVTTPLVATSTTPLPRTSKPAPFSPMGLECDRNGHSPERPRKALPLRVVAEAMDQAKDASMATTTTVPSSSRQPSPQNPAASGELVREATVTFGGFLPSIARASSTQRSNGRSKMTARDVVNAIERYEQAAHADNIGAKQPLLERHVGVPSLRATTGRDAPIIGVDQPLTGVTLEDEADHLKREAALSKPKEMMTGIDAAWNFLHMRHVANTSLEQSGRIHPEADRRNQLFQQALTVMDADKLVKMMRQRAAELDAEVLRLQQFEDRKTKDRQQMLSQGQVVVSDAEHRDLIKRTRSSIRELQNLAAFYRGIDGRRDDARVQFRDPRTFGKVTRTQRDFFLCSERHDESPSTITLPLPHIEQGVREAIAEKRKEQKAQQALLPLPSSPAPSVVTATPSLDPKLEKETLPLLGQFLGLSKEQVIGAATPVVPPSAAASLHASRSTSPRFGTGHRRRHSSPKLEASVHLDADNEVKLPPTAMTLTASNFQLRVEAEVDALVDAAAKKKHRYPTFAFAPKRPKPVDAAVLEAIAASPWSHMNPSL